MAFISTHPLVLLLNAFQLVAILTAYDAEKNESAKYSKFAANLVQGGGDDNNKKEKLVPSKTGMLIIYTPALLVSFAFCFVLPKYDFIVTSTLASWMLLIHFLKRDLEVLFVHKYSGNTLLGLARFIGTYYALYAFAISCVAHPEPSETSSLVGTVLFTMGILGNLYHHYLLATLRNRKSNEDNRRYLPPSGGLFEYVATPHYLFELVGWLGIGVASCSLTGYLTFVSMTMYLSARASNQNKWNRSKFDEKEWPTTRRNILPYVF